ncbi:MAG: RDD family protein [Planctomycetes bacterium]|nr:RDD family protein [Planctomycetota bacterium]
MDIAPQQNPFAAPTSGNAPDPIPGIPIYAGFWWRVLAALIDIAVLLPFTILAQLNTRWWHSLALHVAIVAIQPLYKVVLEAHGATLGKMACGIRLVDANQNGPGIGRSILRNLHVLAMNLVSLVGLLTMPHMFIHAQRPEDLTSMGFMAIGGLTGVLGLFWVVCILFVPFHDEKRGLHDMWAGTWCVRPGRRRAA